MSKLNNNVDSEEIVALKKNNSKIIWGLSSIFNLILNVLYLSFVCYRGVSKYLNLLVFLISFIWTIISLVSTYKLYGKYSSILFYINLIVILFISKIWFVYL